MKEVGVRHRPKKASSGMIIDTVRLGHRKRAVEGFDYDAPDGVAVPSPPKARSKNSPMAPTVPLDENLQEDSIASIVEEFEPVGRAKHGAGERGPPGRPAAHPNAVKRKGKFVIPLSKKQYAAIVKARNKALAKVKALSAELKVLQKRIRKESADASKMKSSLWSVERKVAIASLLQAVGVSGSNVPYVLAVVDYSRFILTPSWRFLQRSTTSEMVERPFVSVW